MSRHSPRDPERIGPSLALEGLSLADRDGNTRLHPTDLALNPGELVTLVGPSGAGKTTLLRLIAGLDRPSAGTIRLDGRESTDLAPHRRGVALMFQEPVVYPHLNVRKNLAFSARARGVTPAALAGPLDRLARLLDLSPLLDRPPSRLSGGERQRVALGRVLLSGARLLLLDEPFARLDVHLRDGVASALRDWQRDHGLTTLLVTHDPAEATRLADRLGVLERGRLVAFGPPRSLYERPDTPTVGRLVGTPAMEFLSLRVEPVDSSISITIEGAAAPIDLRPTIDLAVGPGRYGLGYRPVDPVVALIDPEAAPDPRFLDLDAHLVAVEPLGRDRRCLYRPLGSDQRLVVVERDQGPVEPGRLVVLRLDLRAVCWFPPDELA